MELVEWQRELLKDAQKILIYGGQLHFLVIKRGNERIIETRSYPENFRRYKNVTLIID